MAEISSQKSRPGKTYNDDGLLQRSNGGSERWLDSEYVLKILTVTAVHWIFFFSS